MSAGDVIGRAFPSAGGRRRAGGERRMVPDAEFRSYYGRPVVKPSPWEADIPAYLFLGGLAGGSSLLAAGADLTGRNSLRKSARLAAAAAITAGFAALVHDLGRPARFANMLRVAKPTSPMSAGIWILTAYGPMAGLAGTAELADRLPGRAGRVLRWAGRPAGLVAAGVAPAVASYTAVLLADTATPTWHEAYRELPFVFVGSAAAASGGLGMMTASVRDAGPARRFAVAGALLDLAGRRAMPRRLGIVAEPLESGVGGRLLRTGRTLTTAGAAAAVLGRRHRGISAGAGAALLAGSLCTRFGIFHAGQQSARDPKYTVVPQRDRLIERQPSTSD